MHPSRLWDWFNPDVLRSVALNVAQRRLTDDSGSSAWLADSYRFPAVDDVREAHQVQ